MKSKDDLLVSINKKAPRGLKTDGNSYSVLIVDDSATMRKMIVQMLKSEMYNICGEAGDGEEALERYKELSPDVVTLDINMPGVSGIETLKSILNFDSKAKIVMLTGEGEKKTVIDAIKTGAKNYIIKPPERKNVLDRINEAINS